MNSKTLSMSILVLTGCIRTSSTEPKPSTELRAQDATPSAPDGSCEGLDEDACRSTAGCRVGEGQEVQEVDGGHCLAAPSFAGCQTEDTSGVELPAGGPSCGPDGRQFFFGRVQDTPDGWSQKLCGPLVDALELSPCEGGTPRAMTAEERRLVTGRLASGALSSYQETLQAYRRGDAGAYLDGFAPELTCFYGNTKTGRAALDRARRRSVGRGEVFSAQTQVLRASADEVVFVDYGFYSRSYEEDSVPAGARDYVVSSDDPVEQGVHTKLIVMTEQDGEWRIAAETNRAHQDCVQPGIVADASMPPRFAECSAEHKAALQACDAACGSSVPGHACFVCPDEAWCELKSCLRSKPQPGESCW